MEQLKKLFSNMKQDRKEILRKKRHATGTGGGPAIICTVEDGDLNDDLFDKMIAKPIEGAIDSDLTVVTPESVDDEYSVDDPGISYSEVVVEEEVLVDSTLNTTSEEPHLQPEPLPQPCTSRPTVIQKPESLKRKGTKLPQRLGSRSKVSCEVEAKGNRVLIQQQQDEELHLLLVTMYKAEAELAQFNLQQAKAFWKLRNNL
ncbi:hypothetical protein M8J76_015752 [Diaphorina citri]|nr:hypothetical protein M8J76_015752 [Diaphorina citri]